jgi:hypothetical protein
MRSAVRQAIPWMVRDGLTPPTVGNTEPSQIHKFGMSQLRQSGVDDAVAAIVPHPRGAVQMGGVVVFVPELARAGQFETLAH